MSAPTTRVTCPVCRRPGRRVTKAGTIRRHQPWGTNFSGGLVLDCAGSGMAAFRERKPS